jgi:hypothetical protein
MQLDAVGLKPTATARLQLGRLGNTAQAQHPGIKFLRRILLPRGHGKLDMLKRNYNRSHHVVVHRLSSLNKLTDFAALFSHKVGQFARCDLAIIDIKSTLKSAKRNLP